MEVEVTVSLPQSMSGYSHDDKIMDAVCGGLGGMPSLEVPRANLNVIWDCSQINYVSLTGLDGKIQLGWRCSWCQSGGQMFKTPHATKALAHVLRIPKSDICVCTGHILESYMASYRDLYERTVLLGKDCQMMTGDMWNSMNEFQERMASGIGWSRRNSGVYNKVYVFSCFPALLHSCMFNLTYLLLCGVLCLHPQLFILPRTMVRGVKISFSRDLRIFWVDTPLTLAALV